MLALMGISLAIAALQTLGMLVGGSAVALGIAVAVRRSIREGSPAAGPPGSETWQPRPRKRDPGSPD